MELCKATHDAHLFHQHSEGWGKRVVSWRPAWAMEKLWEMWVGMWEGCAAWACLLWRLQNWQNNSHKSASQTTFCVRKFTKILFSLQVKVTSHLPISNDLFHLSNTERICSADYNTVATRPTQIQCYSLITKHFHNGPVKNTSWKQNKAREKSHPWKILLGILSLSILSKHHVSTLFPPRMPCFRFDFSPPFLGHERFWEITATCKWQRCL